MDGCNKCCGIDTVSLTCGSLQVFPWNNNTIIQKINGSNRCRQITDFIQYIHSWKQGGIIVINYDISLLQLFLQWRNWGSASGARAPPWKKIAQIKAMFFSESNMYLHQEIKRERTWGFSKKTTSLGSSTYIEIEYVFCGLHIKAWLQF